MNRSFDTSQMTSVSTSGFDAIEMSPTNVESSGGGGGDGGRKEKRRSVRLVHCGDGVIEECDEDIEERMRSRKQELEQQLAEEKRLEIESRHMKWLPWSLYIAKRSAVRTVRMCDFMGEKLAWWLGITQPKFLFEIEEYTRIHQNDMTRNPDDMAEQVTLGPDGKIRVVHTDDTALTTHFDLTRGDADIGKSQVFRISTVDDSKMLSSNKSATLASNANAATGAESTKLYSPLGTSLLNDH